MTNVRNFSLLDTQIVGPAAMASLRKLAPRHVAKNPVMFVVEIGSVLTTLVFLRDLIGGVHTAPLWFTASVSLWLVVHRHLRQLRRKRWRRGAVRRRRRRCAGCARTPWRAG
jgi:high-affinity K+ transport system ATPase subunit B